MSNVNSVVGHPSAVLLVDDDPIFLAVAEAAIGSLGDYDVTCASNGAEGLDALRSRQREFGLIVLDLNMPELDGLAFLRGAAELGFKGSIILSSGESEAVLRSAQHMGDLLKVRILGALKKPLTASSLAVLLAAGEVHQLHERQAARQMFPERLDTLELVPYFQAQHDAWDGSVLGVEALIRAKAPDGQIHGPGKLFGLVHGHDELVRVTLQIARKVLDDVVFWRAAGCTCRTSINFDARVAEDPEVGSAVLRMVRDRQLDPDLICLELTETALPADMTRLIEALTRLRMAGFEVSLDDYGTGGSNFELLRLCPFTEIKIDGSIIRSAADEVITRRFVESTVAMAADIGLRVVGEGVETDAQLEMARNSGILLIQGFLFSRPQPAGQLLQMLQESPLRRAS